MPAGTNMRTTFVASITILILLLAGSALFYFNSGESPELRVMTYNIRAAAESNLEQIAAEIESHRPDVVALQEVDVNWGARSGFEDQAAYLAKALDMHSFFGEIYDLPPAGGREENRKYGLALLSKHPIEFRKNHRLTRLSSQHDTDEPLLMPGFPGIVINISGRRIHIFNTHLDYRSDPSIRETEVAEMLEIIRELAEQEPVILMGDLNAEPEDPELAALFDIFGDAWEGEDGEGFTFPAAGPTKRIDYILYSDHFKITGVYVSDTRKSDHRPVVGDLLLE